jgi:hypothetical protein
MCDRAAHDHILSFPRLQPNIIINTTPRFDTPSQFSHRLRFDTPSKFPRLHHNLSGSVLIVGSDVTFDGVVS